MPHDYWTETSAVPSTLSVPPLFLRALPECARVLDVGCGAGEVAAKLAGRAAYYVGIDCNYPSLAQARRQGRDVILADALALPCASKSFHAALFRAVFTVLPSLASCRQAMAEALRVAELVCVYDFLLTPENPYHAARYPQGRAETGENGAFFVRQEGRVLYRAKHFTPEELFSVVDGAGGKVVDNVLSRDVTRSGQDIRSICLLARRRCDEGRGRTGRARRT